MLGLIAVFIGGGIGASLRYLISLFAGNFALTYQGTFVINIIGCLFLGFVSYIALKKEKKFNPDLKLFLTTGIAGGFTTFSTFCNEIFKLAQTDQMLTGCLYLFSSVALGLFAAGVGVLLAKQVLLFRFAGKLARNSKTLS